MENQVNYIANIIWIDDQANDEILDNAANEGLYLQQFYYVDAGMDALKNAEYQWHAVIFDAKCKIHSENDEDNLDALGEGITRLREISTEIPWFVLTAGDFEGEEAIRYIVGTNERRPWDPSDKRFYTKFGDQPQLWADIKESLTYMPLYKTWLKYHSAFGFYGSPDLVRLLDSFENEGETFDRNEEFLHSIRLILDSLFIKFNDCGLLSLKFNGSNLAECSRQLGLKPMQSVVPRYIQRSLHMCVDCCNPGSHRHTDEEFPTLQCVKDGSASYLNRSIMLCLLNILEWCNSLPKDSKNIENLKAVIAKIDSGL